MSTSENTPQKQVISRKERKNAREVSALCQSAKHIIPSAAFQRCVDETIQSLGDDVAIQISRDAREALQVSSEAYIHDVISGASTYMAHAGRDTLMSTDIQAEINRIRT